MPSGSLAFALKVTSVPTSIRVGEKVIAQVGSALVMLTVVVQVPVSAWSSVTVRVTVFEPSVSQVAHSSAVSVLPGA